MDANAIIRGCHAPYSRFMYRWIKVVAHSVQNDSLNMQNSCLKNKTHINNSAGFQTYITLIFRRNP